MIYFYFTLYIVIINIIGFLLMFIDKKKAIKGSYRISEKALFVTAAFLGAVGIYLGMYSFRHKTKHNLFTIGIPILIIINILSIYYILSNNILNNILNYFFDLFKFMN